MFKELNNKQLNAISQMNLTELLAIIGHYVQKENDLQPVIKLAEFDANGNISERQFPKMKAKNTRYESLRISSDESTNNILFAARKNYSLLPVGQLENERIFRYFRRNHIKLSGELTIKTCEISAKNEPQSDIIIYLGEKKGVFDFDEMEFIVGQKKFTQNRIYYGPDLTLAITPHKYVFDDGDEWKNSSSDSNKTAYEKFISTTHPMERFFVYNGGIYTCLPTYLMYMQDIYLVSYKNPEIFKYDTSRINHYFSIGMEIVYTCFQQKLKQGKRSKRAAIPFVFLKGTPIREEPIQEEALKQKYGFIMP